MAFSKQGMLAKPQRNDQEMVKFMLKTDDELSDLNDRTLWIRYCGWHRASSEEEFLSDKKT